MASARSTTAAVEDMSTHVAQGSSSAWDRIASWYGDNKVAAWTIAGVTVVAVGGSIYYLSQPPPVVGGEKKTSKKSKKKAAKNDVEKDAGEGAAQSKAGR